METLYVAYGLALRSSFRLPGMQATDAEGLPPLALKLVTVPELEQAWSGDTEAPIWRGRLGDGGELTIERGIAGDLLFTDGDRARHCFDLGAHSLLCAPRHAGLDWQRTLVTKVLSSISVMCGYEALHASAVDSPYGAVAIAAPTGMGKTTLALELMRRAWPLLSDDVLALAATPDGVLAYPGTPHMNVALDTPEDLAPTLGVLSRERWVAVRDVAREPRPVHAVCLLERRRGLPLEVQVLPPSPLPLAPYVLGLPGDAGRERSRFELYADLMGSVALLRLTCDPTAPSEALAELLEQVLADPPAAAAERRAAPARLTTVRAARPVALLAEDAR